MIEAVAVALGVCSAAAGSWLITDPGCAAWARVWRARLRARQKAARAGWARMRVPGPPEGLARAVGRLVPLGGRLRVAREAARQERQKDRRLDELAELVDVVSLGLSAGISFDAALAIYCSRYDTALAGELGEAMQSWRLGLASRSDALGALARRMDVGAFTTFAETVTEALDFGAPLARTLAEQAQAIRDERRSAVQERIEKTPVKMLLPTGALILPAMLLAILGPLLASLSEVGGV